MLLGDRIGVKESGNTSGVFYLRKFYILFLQVVSAFLGIQYNKKTKSK